MRGIRYISFILLICLALTAKTQSLKKLQEEKEKTRKEIKYTNYLLDKAGENSKASLNKLLVLKKRISLRNKLITDYNSQLELIQQSIDDNELVIGMLGEDLSQIKLNYDKLIQQAYRNREGYNQLFFLLSSESFNQAYKRLLYTRQMANYRQKQAEQIEAIKFVLEQKSNDLVNQKKEHKDVLVQQMQESSVLKNEQQKHTTSYQQLQKRQRELKKHLKYQERVSKKLQNEIERIIAEEAKKSKSIDKTPEYKNLSSSFEKNKGKFPWPTAEGIITDKFGEHAHPVMKNIIIKNNGVDITTKPGQKARSIFNGVVSKIFAIPGGNTAVIIRHGQYISVYSNLKDVFIKQGDQVSTKQDIGLIFSDKSDNNKTVLKFQIWKESVKQNPEYWIAK